MAPTAPSLPGLARAAATLADPQRVADAVVDALARVERRALHTCTFFSGPASLDVSNAAVRIDGTTLSLAGFASAYARSPVRWDRWRVGARDASTYQLTSLDLEESPLLRFWRGVGMADYRRRVVAIDGRAVALVSSASSDGRRLPAERWTALASTVDAAVAAVRMAGASLVRDVPDEVLAYFSPDGALLACAPRAGHAAARVAVQARLRAGERGGERIIVDGVAYALRYSTALAASEVYELVLAGEDREALRPRDAAVVEWLDRGLTNREIASVTGRSEKAVKKALERLYARYDASNRMELLHRLSRSA